MNIGSSVAAVKLTILMKEVSLLSVYYHKLAAFLPIIDATFRKIVVMVLRILGYNKFKNIEPVEVLIGALVINIESKSCMEKEYVKLKRIIL